MSHHQRARQRMTFDVQAAIPKAWTFLWRANLARQQAGEDYRGQSTYLTASDVEAQVRQFAQEQFDGRAPGSTGPARGRRYTVVRLTTGRPGGVFGLIRDWLLAEVRAGRLEIFKFGRGHISGARFRPAGQGPNLAEEQSMDRKRARQGRPAPVHASVSGRHGGRPLCTKERRRGFSWRPSRFVRTTAEPGEVTCARCRNRITEMPVHQEEEEI